MKGHIEYLVGYSTALMVAISQSISVACYLIPNTHLLIALSSAACCFVLNLMLYWQSFSSILELPEKLTLSNLVPILLTTCCCLILYAFTVFSFAELSLMSPLIAQMFPLPSVHCIALGFSVASFGLYIDSCIELDLKNLPFESLFWSSVLSYILLYSTYALPLFLLTGAFIYKKRDGHMLFQSLAACASIVLCINGYGASLPLLYNFAKTKETLLVLKALSYLGIASLIICDALFNIEQVNKYQKSNRKLSRVFSPLILLNAVANSQITALGKGFACVEAWIGGIMSFVVMQNSTQELANNAGKSSKAPIPPFSNNDRDPYLLLLLNCIGVFTYSTWLRLFRPSAYMQLTRFANIQLFPMSPLITVGKTLQFACVVTGLSICKANESHITRKHTQLS